MNSFHLFHLETLDEKNEMFPLFCKTGKNGFSLHRRFPFSMPRDFQQRFPFFSCFSDSINELVVPNAHIVTQRMTAHRTLSTSVISPRQRGTM
jgi:hypothetical protein